jgi:hypothetical protein
MNGTLAVGGQRCYSLAFCTSIGSTWYVCKYSPVLWRTSNNSPTGITQCEQVRLAAPGVKHGLAYIVASEVTGKLG